MYLYLLLLRILHITCGVFWAGTAFLMVFYIFPAVKKAGPDGGKILQGITATNRFPQVIVIAAGITVVTGLLLMWHLSGGFTPAWFTTRYGMALGTGGATALVAFFQAVLINMPSLKRSANIMSTVAGQGGVPTDNQRIELVNIRNRVVLSTHLISLWLGIAVVTMAAARYL